MDVFIYTLFGLAVAGIYCIYAAYREHVVMSSASQADMDYRALSDTPPYRAEGREPKVNVLFRTVMKHEASDLHLKTGQPPMMRLKNVIRRMDAPPINGELMQE